MEQRDGHGRFVKGHSKVGECGCPKGKRNSPKTEFKKGHSINRTGKWGRCQICDGDMWVPKYRDNIAKYCSKKCSDNAMIGNTMPIEIREKISNALKGKLNHVPVNGERHYSWKGGVSKGYRRKPYSAEYKEWRRKVFTRDNYTCVECDYQGYVYAHHIKSFIDYPEARFDINNGKTLCKSCHTKTDNYGGKNRRKEKCL